MSAVDRCVQCGNMAAYCQCAPATPEERKAQAQALRDVPPLLALENALTSLEWFIGNAILHPSEMNEVAELHAGLQQLWERKTR